MSWEAGVRGLEPREALGGLGPWEQAGANWSLGRGGLGRPWGGLGRPRALGANWSLGRPWEASGLGSELERGARCEPPGETFTT